MHKILITTVTHRYETGASVATCIAEFTTRQEATEAVQRINTRTARDIAAVTSMDVKQNALALNF